MKLVLLPGMDGTGDLFAPLFPVLSPRWEPIVVSYPIDRPLGYGELEALVRPHLPVNEPYAILGESFSGPVAIALAASNPDCLVSLILCCSFARNPHPKLAALKPLLGVLSRRRIPSMLIDFALLGSDSNEEQRSAVELALAKLAPGVLGCRLREALAVDATRKLERVALPILYLRATRDRVVPKSALEEIQRHSSHVKVMDVDSPHCLLQVNPKAAAAAIDDFLPEQVNAL